MNCEEVMKRDVQHVRRDDTVQRAAARMRDANIGFLPVCADDLTAIGTITDRDIAVRLAAEDRSASSTRVAEVMTHEVVACRPGEDLWEAERLMAQNHKSRMMVTDEQGHLVGVLSLSDIADHDSSRRAAATMREVSARESRL
jgi:CBS domain-containing protein